MTQFRVNDTVRWSTPAGTRNVKVVECWHHEPKMLLVTDEHGTTMDTKPVLQCDCTLVSRPEDMPPKHFSRKKETAKEKIEYKVANDE